MDKTFLNDVQSYYNDRIMTYGEVAKGVDWNSKESQYLRFDQLTRNMNFDEEFTILDYGCGYGEFYKYLTNRLKLPFHYTGFDIVSAMLDKGRSIFKSNLNADFRDAIDDVQFDYLIASGIFNVKPAGIDKQRWLDYIIDTISQFDQHSKKGFSFNMLTIYSDDERMKDYLYYADPLSIFDFCKKNISRDVALIHDYGLYEFTINVTK